MTSRKPAKKLVEGPPAGPVEAVEEQPSAGVQDAPELLDPVPPAPPPLAAVRRYVNRIQIVEAWQYRGTLRDAPDFIDRSWAAWDDASTPPGPALRVPGDRDEPKLCRGGDYVVRQQVTVIDGLPPDERVEVWGREEFERLFMPTTRGAPGPDSELEEVPRQVPPVAGDPQMEDA